MYNCTAADAIRFFLSGNYIKEIAPSIYTQPIY